MGLARGWSVALCGVTGRLVSVEADIGNGLPGFSLIGLPDAALNEARDRVKAAVQNSAEPWPQQKITVSLSPADLHKRGSGFDLVLAAVVLAAHGTVPARPLADLMILGELGLDGTVRGLRGVLPAVAAASRAGILRAVVPEANAAEAALVCGVEVTGVSSLRQLVAVLRGELLPADDHPAEPPTSQSDGALASVRADAVPDLVDVRGQEEARRALEVAAAGGHHVFLHGSPGAGKTMLARRLPGLLPPLSARAAMEVTEIHSVAGILPPGTPLVTAAPYRAPHHSATSAAMVGGGSREIRPGAVSLAHQGVLFIDEATEFRGGVLDGLRQPLETGEVVIARAGVTACYPADFLLVMAANPCPCGAAGGPRSCLCSSEVRRRYLGRLSRPLLDRIDIQVMVDRPSRHELLGGPEGESTAVVADRIREARERAVYRLAGTGWSVNAQVPARALRTRFPVAPGAMAGVERALDRGTLSARGLDRVLRLAWTVADLGRRDVPGPGDVGAALALRAGVAGGWAA